MAAIIPKIPEKVPAKRNSSISVNFQPKRACTCYKNNKPTEIDKYFRISLIIIRVQLVLLLIGLE